MEGWCGSMVCEGGMENCCRAWCEYILCVGLGKTCINLIFVENCVQLILADRLSILGRPFGFYTGFKLRIPGGPFD